MKPNRQPFQNVVDTSIFFGGGTRREIVDDIKTALDNEVPLLTLTGTDGSGKTMICRMVEQELKETSEILYFEQGAESFDEIVNRIAAQVELEETDEISDRNTRLEKSVEILNQNNRRLIIILDGADTIFPATLERIRRMFDQVNDRQLSIQMLFSGRPLFSLNYKQLGIISFKIVEEKHLSLDPLDGKDTHLYLNHCLDISDTEEQKRFSLAQAEEIADIARGNFRLINQLAGKFLDLKRLASKKEESAEDDYDDVDPDSSDEASRLSAGLGNVDLDFLKVPRIGVRWYATGGAIIAVILLLVFLRGGGDEEIVPDPESEQVPELTLEKVVPDPIEIPQPSLPVEPLEPPSPPVAPEEPETLIVRDGPAEPAVEVLESTTDDVSQDELAEEVDSSAAPTGQEPGDTGQRASSPAEPSESETFTGQIVSEEASDELQAEIEEPAESVEAAEAPPAPIEGDSAAVEIVPEDRAPIETSVEVPAEVEPEQPEELAQGQDLSEQPPGNERSEPDDSAAIPKLAVLTKKKPSAEPEPISVVTLKSDSKIRPDQLTAPAPPVEPEPAQTPTLQAPSEEPRPSPAEEDQAEPAVAVISTPFDQLGYDLENQEAEAEAAAISVSPRSQARVKDSEILYAQRLAAGSRWLVGGSRDKYTVQLMVLDSKDAQQNVRYMLAEEDYQGILDQLYILRKTGQPQTVMLYWGEFDTPAEARQAKGQLPSFLSRLEPFEIPVKDAVAKARAGQ